MITSIFLPPVAGIRVMLHWSVLIGLPICLIVTRSLPGGLLAFCAFGLILLAHEAGHAFVARRLGLRVLGISAYFVHGQCLVEQPRSEREEVAFAWGGVLGQAALFACTGSFAYLSYLVGPRIPDVLDPAFMVLNGATIFIAGFNLLPHPKLDGGTAWRRFPIEMGRPEGRESPRPCKKGRPPASHLRLVEKDEAPHNDDET